MNFQNKTEFLNSLVKKEDEVKKALTKLYQGVRATNKFLGLENSPELQDTYYKLRVEEVGELFTAIKNEDKVEFLDAVVDGLVVVGYEFFLYGYNSEDYISKEKPPVRNSVSELHKNYKEKEQTEMEVSLSNLEIIFRQLDIDHMKAVNEVLESNWSKFPTITTLLNAVCDYIDFINKPSIEDLCSMQVLLIEKQGRYVDVYHEVRYDESIGEDRLIFWAKGEKQSDGSIKEFKAPKYVKPCTFKEPDFASCWLN